MTTVLGTDGGPGTDAVTTHDRATSRRGAVRPVLAALVLALVATVLGATSGSAQADEVPEPPVATAVVPVEPPVVTGTSRYGSTLTASPGTWSPTDASVAYQWLRDGAPITGATAATYRLGAADHARAVSVRVTASNPELDDAVTTTAPTTVGPALLVSRARPVVSGTRRYGKTLTASAGRWSTGGVTLRYRWYRDRKPVAGATRRTYTIKPGDVGHRLAVRVTASKRYHQTRWAASLSTGLVKHRRDVRRTITYSVRRNGSKASLSTFRTQAAQTLADARGWRGGGIRFKEVSKGGSFTLVLAKASRVPSYSSGCSSTYSCRVGRNVIINETRWNKGTSVWSKARRSIRDYRHMVVNHEVGHFLGKGHARCPGKGKAAPVMQQQSKGLQGCKANPWPKTGEL
ncbi:DUF3152 domain-containing protein [Aeromicrobium sp.]|uniref:DUF3152 domain-containing protein n=1 Tax=Aeromicrobium sp. TaxID=1871063 RepID=UPI0040337C5B